MDIRMNVYEGYVSMCADVKSIWINGTVENLITQPFILRHDDITQTDCEFFFGSHVTLGGLFDAMASIASIGVPYDADSDGDCDLYDVTGVSSLYGANIWKIGFDDWYYNGIYYQFDTNGNWEIDIFDVVTFANAYGWSF